MSNLRILYDNISDKADLTVSSYVGTLMPSNLKSNKKSKIWRSAEHTNQSISATWGSPQAVNCVVLAATNLSPSSYVNITLEGVGNEVVYTTGLIQALLGLADSPGVNAYSYSTNNYVVIYLPNIIEAAKVTIQLVDTTNPSGYLEVSRLIIGKYWSPRFNTGFGMSITGEDSTSVDRSDSGDLIIVKGVRGRKLTFDLTWMDAGDRNNFNNIINLNGKSIPVFVSLFPESTDKLKEQIFQIFGPLVQESALTHSMHTMYSGRMEVNEI